MISRRRILILVVFLLPIALISQGRMIQLNDTDIELYVEVQGNGQPILFIPGWTMTSQFFNKQTDFFKENYQVITYDPRSHGKSTKTEIGNTYKVHAQDLAVLIQKLNLDELILVGWSSGCATIYEYVKQFGTSHLSKLVFIDEPPKWVGDTKTEWVYGSFEDYRGGLYDLIEDPEGYANGIVQWMLKKEVDKETETWMLNEISQTPKYAALNLYIDGLVSDYQNTLKSINGKLPTLYMVRENVLDSSNDWLKQHAPKIKCVPISSHAMFWESPLEFNAILGDFLQSD